ncbi:hypothetical protein BDY19DRAFT_937431 [Irpex rosettiformis]|uniref:Uncharacterized protein n=1 Tax=Irpex rosettiformis TaxID=378272 RepID=A0ACB8U926_9APHY|nr:hypothetical protein BDY19DRAFT_937431 [Irpex rosettiformis]
MSDIGPQPSDGELLVYLAALYAKQPTLGAEKIHKQLLEDNPSWRGKVGLKRVKQVRKDNGLLCTAAGAPASNISYPNELPSVLNVRSVYGSPGASNARAIPPNDFATIENLLNLRAAQGSEAFLAQNSMHTAALKAGRPYGAGWYAVLQDGEEEYVHEKVVWVNTAAKEEDVRAIQAAVTMLERGKAEALLGNIAGVYLVFKGVWSALQEMDEVKQGNVKVTERSLAKQLKNEYGIDVMPFMREAERNPSSPAGRQLTALIMSMVSSNLTSR